MHARRFSLEAFTRAGSDDSRKNIVDLSEGSSSAPRRLSQALADFASTSKAASRGHNRNSSIASQLSFTSVTSDGASSVATRRSSVRSDTGVTVVGADEVVKEGIVPSSPPPSAFKTIKSIFRRSLGGYVPIALNPSTIEVTKAGVLDRASLEKLIWERQGQIDRVTTFTMSKESYIGWGQLAETLEFLGRSLPTLKEVHIISQVFTLEELHGLASPLALFPNLQRLSILDSQDDPPAVCQTFSKILSIWAESCPTLLRVQFKTGSWWEPRLAVDLDKGTATEWTERSSAEDDALPPKADSE